MTAVWCLSLWQPWAFAYASGVKGIETRAWSALRRKVNTGDVILVHATKKRDAEIRWECERLGVNIEDLCFGGLIGAVVFDREMRFTEDTPNEVSETEQRWGNFAPGRYGFVARDPLITTEMFPCRGSQFGFFPPPDGARDWLHRVAPTWWLERQKLVAIQ